MSLFTKKIASFLGLFSPTLTPNAFEVLTYMNGGFVTRPVRKYVTYNADASVDVSGNPVISLQVAAGASIALTLDTSLTQGAPNTVVTVKRNGAADIGTITINAPSRLIQNEKNEYKSASLILPFAVQQASWILSAGGNWELIACSYWCPALVETITVTGTTNLTALDCGKLYLSGVDANLTYAIQPGIPVGWFALFDTNNKTGQIGFSGSGILVNGAAAGGGTKTKASGLFQPAILRCTSTNWFSFNGNV